MMSRNRVAQSKGFTPRNSNGFTLIELLVVIAIIAILAAILFPVFAQAREKARSITCLSNVRQISLGFQGYVQDYDETFPIAWGDTPDTWVNRVYPYIKNGGTSNKKADGTLYNPGAAATDIVGNRSTGLFHCPDDSDNPATLSYTTNANLMGAGTFRQAKSLAAINLPADLIAFGETAKPYFKDSGYTDTGTDFVSVRLNPDGDVNLDETSEAANQWYNRDYQCASNDVTDDHIDPNSLGWRFKYLKFRHNRTGRGSGFANVAYGDGHAKSVRFGQISGKNWLPLLNSNSVGNTKYTGTCPPATSAPDWSN